MKTQNIHVQVEQDIYDKIKKLAKDDVRTLKATIQILLNEALKNREEVK